MLGKEALVVLYQLSRVMSEKREEPLFQVRWWVNVRITIAVAKSYSRMIRGARLPSPLQEQEPIWDPELGIGLQFKIYAQVTPCTTLQTPPSHTGIPPRRTTRGATHRIPYITGYRRKKHTFLRKNQGLDKKPVKQETYQKRGIRDQDNMANKKLTSRKKQLKNENIHLRT